MKYALSLLCVLLTTSSSLLFAQTPEGFSYQAVIRDNGAVLTNQLVAIQFSILDNGSVIYEETHSVSTNEFGLVTAVIGEGAVLSGSFDAIDWASGQYALQVQIDSGSGQQDMGASDFQSVPFSRYSDRAHTVDSLNLADLVDVGTVNTGEILQWTGTEWITVPDQVDDADADPANELQSLSISGNTLSLSNGNSIALPAGTTYSAGSGISISGSVISNTAPDQTVTLSGSGATSVSGSYPNFTISSTDNNTTYSAGSGISISGTTISNTGDTNASDDITNGTAAGGDLSGSFPDPAVTGIRSNPVSATTPSVGEVLKWTGSEWAPSGDNAGSSLWTQTSSDIHYSAGSVGIGTSNIDAALEISHNSSLSNPHILIHENANDYARLNLANNNGSNYWTIAGYIASNNKNDRLNFWNGDSGDLLSLTGDGRLGLNVGISPKTSFHVGNDHRVLFGQDTLGSGDKLMWLPDLHAFRVGTVATGAASTYWNRDSIGLYSFASGLNTRAQGFGATAMGRDTEATNSYAFASGFFSNADGQYSTAMGFNTDALALGSTALGYSTDAEENYSFAAGYFAEAQAIYSVAIGNGVQAQSYASMAVGRYNVGGGSSTSWLSGDPIFEVGIGTSNSNRANAMTIRKNGNVGIGTTVPLATLHVNGQVRFQSVEYFEDGGTNEIATRGDLRPTSDNTYDLGTSALRWDDIYATSGVVNTSDIRDKEAIEPLSYGLSTVMDMKPVSYQWKHDPLHTRKLGLIAQDLLLTVPEVVKTQNINYDEDTNEMIIEEAERLGVYYSDLIPVLIKGMQEQQQIIEAQEARIRALEDKLGIGE